MAYVNYRRIEAIHTLNFWRIIYYNYHNKTGIEYFRNKENASKRFQMLLEEGKEMSDFEQKDSNSFAYFDSNYNRYSTFITLEELVLNDLFID